MLSLVTPVYLLLPFKKGKAAMPDTNIICDSALSVREAWKCRVMPKQPDHKYRCKSLPEYFQRINFNPPHLQNDLIGSQASLLSAGSSLCLLKRVHSRHRLQGTSR